MVSRNAEILIPEVVGIDGDVKVKVTVKPNADAGEPYWLLRTTRQNRVHLFLWRNVFISTPGEVLLAGGEFSICRIQSHKERVGVGAGDIQNHPSRRHRFTFPQSVTIPAGDSGVYFYVSVKPDNALMKNQTLLSHWK